MVLHISFGCYLYSTSLPLGTEVLKELSPFTVSISVNLEPIYAILSLMIFGESEIMSMEFYIGAAIILTKLS